MPLILSVLRRPLTVMVIIVAIWFGAFVAVGGAVCDQFGIRAGDDVEVLSGLEPSDAIVLLRADALKDGQAVGVISPEPQK